MLVSSLSRLILQKKCELFIRTNGTVHYTPFLKHIPPLLKPFFSFNGFFPSAGAYPGFLSMKHALVRIAIPPWTGCLSLLQGYPSAVCRWYPFMHLAGCQERQSGVKLLV